MCESVSITIRKDDITEDLINHILKMDDLGVITLDARPTRLVNETWVEAFERQKYFTNEFLSEVTANSYRLSKMIDEAVIVSFGADTKLDDTEMADELSRFNTEVRVWFESCDGFDPYELLIFADGDHITYNVDTNDGGSYIRAEAVHYIRNYPPAEFKGVVMDLLQATRYNSKANYEKPFDDVIPEHKVAGVLGKLDDGEIEPKEALKLIKEIQASKVHDYLVFIHAEYCDAQAFVSTPDGEFGGDGYIELNDACPICIGTYRSESADKAIEQAAINLESDKEIFYAVQIQQ